MQFNVGMWMLNSRPNLKSRTALSAAVKLLVWLIVSEMTYNVSMGTLNPTIPYHTLCGLLTKLIQHLSVDSQVLVQENAFTRVSWFRVNSTRGQLDTCVELTAC